MFLVGYYNCFYWCQIRLRFLQRMTSCYFWLCFLASEQRVWITLTTIQQPSSKDPQRETIAAIVLSKNQSFNSPPNNSGLSHQAKIIPGRSSIIKRQSYILGIPKCTRVTISSVTRDQLKPQITKSYNLPNNIRYATLYKHHEGVPKFFNPVTFIPMPDLYSDPMPLYMKTANATPRPAIATTPPLPDRDTAPPVEIANSSGVSKMVNVRI